MFELQINGGGLESPKFWRGVCLNGSFGQPDKIGCQASQLAHHCVERMYGVDFNSERRLLSFD